MKVLLVSLRALVVLTVVTGVIYPLAVLGVTRFAFPVEAGGSLVTVSGRLAGSALLGQAFTRPEYFWGRPSVGGYDAKASGGSNLSPVSAEQVALVASRRAALVASNPRAPGEVPPLLLTASASGLDPHVSPEAALWQVPRVARARGIDEVRVAALVREVTEPRTFGVLGEPRVNVLDLNRELDRRFPARN